MNNFFDQYGFLHLNENEITKENAWVRIAQYYVMNKPWGWEELEIVRSLINKNIKKTIYKKTESYQLLSYDSGTFRTYPTSENTDLSHDDYTAIYCLALLSGWNIKNLHIFNKRRLHPRDISFYLVCHYPFFRFPLLAFHNIFILVAFLQTWKIRPRYKTEVNKDWIDLRLIDYILAPVLNPKELWHVYKSGDSVLKRTVRVDQRLLAFSRMKSFKMNWSFWWFSKMIKWNKHIKSWRNCFVIMYKNVNIPLRKLSKGL